MKGGDQMYFRNKADAEQEAARRNKALEVPEVLKRMGLTVQNHRWYVTECDRLGFIVAPTKQ